MYMSVRFVSIIADCTNRTVGISRRLETEELHHFNQHLMECSILSSP